MPIVCQAKSADPSKFFSLDTSNFPLLSRFVNYLKDLPQCSQRTNVKFLNLLSYWEKYNNFLQHPKGDFTFVVWIDWDEYW